MKNFLSSLAAALIAINFTSGLNAATTVNTIPGDNQANMSVDAGQTFTTGVLGAENLLDTIEIQGPQAAQAGSTLGPFNLTLFADLDQKIDTLDLGAALATSDAQTLGAGDGTTPGSGPVSTFRFASLPALDDNTVYSFVFTDAAGTTNVPARIGLLGGQPYAGGEVFSGGAIPFGGTFDTAMRINTVPEPATLVLAGLSLIGLIGLRRRG